jgi:dienelactone hydrolase
MKMKILTIAAGLIFAMSLGAEVKKNDVNVPAPDGVNLKGTYFSSGQRGPAILLLHQCNMDRHAWDGLATDLAGSGVHVLTIDYRGYGESGGGKYADASERRKAAAEKWPSDVDAAFAFLKAQKGVDSAHLAAGGASCGVTQSSDLATRHHEIRALLLLSGVASDAARSYIAGDTSLAIFGAASEGDSDAAQGIREALAASKDPQSTLKIYPGTEHGVPMFAKHADLEPGIVGWLKVQLGSGGTH